MSSLTDTLAQFVPIDRRLAMGSERGIPEVGDAAILFADITGFTPLTNGLVEMLGPRRGAEETVRHVNAVYDRLIAEVHRYQGAVTGFSGDAITCTFDSADAAVTCAVRMQKSVGRLEAVEFRDKTVPLAIKVSVASGAVRRVVAGDPDTSLFDVLTGEPLDRVASAHARARTGDVVIDRASWRSLKSRVMVDDVTGAGSDADYLVVRDLEPDWPATPWPDSGSLDLDEGDLRCWVLPSVYEKLRADHGSFLAELRTATALFLQFDGIDYEGDRECGDKLDHLIVSIQAIVSECDGVLLQLTTGDKGSYVYIVFGAPFGHEDDSRRALETALRLKSLGAEIPFLTSVRMGVAKGLMRTGVCGSARRQTYAVMGDATNLAARLMIRAVPGEVLVHGDLGATLQGRFDFHDHEPLSVYGHPKPAAVSALINRAQTTVVAVQSPKHGFIGRARERAMVDEHLSGPATKPAGVLLIEGEAGIGKSRLADYLRETAEASSIATTVAAPESIHEATPYFVWREILSSLLGSADRINQDPLRRRLLEFVSSDTWLEDRAPLLNTVLPLDIDENDLTRQMTGEIRIANLNAMLIRLVRWLTGGDDTKSAMQHRRLVIIDDAHWLDSASWSLANGICRECPEVVLALFFRPLGQPEPSGFANLTAAPHVRRIPLRGLSDTEIEAIVEQRLGVTGVPQPACRWIREKAQGNPFYSQELAQTLLDRGVLLVKGGRCWLDPAMGELITLDVPDTLEGVIRSRLDRLSPQQQLVSKVASIVGRTFSLEILRRIYPTEVTKRELVMLLDSLEDAGITVTESAMGDPRYAFKHAVIQQVAYNLLLFSQRRSLHESLASWYEERQTPDGWSDASLLAHHWDLAENIPKALHYLESAAARALNEFDNRGAIRLFRRALELAPTESSSRIARWELQLGKAYVNESQYSLAVEHLRKGVEILGQPVPPSPLRLGFSIVAEVGAQLLHRSNHGRFVGRLASRKEELITASRAYQDLTEIFYFNNHPALSFCSALRSLNLAESAGFSPELASGYANVGGMAGFLGFHKLAERYRNKALEVAEATEDMSAISWVTLTSGLYHIGMGEWKAAGAHFERLRNTAERLGDWRRRTDAVGNQAMIAFLKGQFERSLSVFTELHRDAVNRDDVRYTVDTLRDQLYCLLMLNRLHEVDEGLAELEKWIEHGLTNEKEAALLDLHAIGASASFRRGRLGDAFDKIAQAIAVLDTSADAVSYYSGFVSRDCVAETALQLWERVATDLRTECLDGLSTSRLRTYGDKACKALRSASRAFGAARPAAALNDGRLLWMTGRRSRAIAALERSLRLADEHEMDYTKAVAAWELARRSPPGAEDTKSLVEEAKVTFERIHTSFELETLNNSWRQDVDR